MVKQITYFSIGRYLDECEDITKLNITENIAHNFYSTEIILLN